MRKVAQKISLSPRREDAPREREVKARDPEPAFRAELDLTGWRGLAKSATEAKADFDSPLMKQFLTDLKAEAGRRGVTVDRIERQLGRWKDGLEPSLKVEVTDGRTGVLKLAATLGKNYNQDAVLVLSKGGNATVYQVALPKTVSRRQVGELLDEAGLPGSTSSLDGRHLTLVALGKQTSKVQAFLDSIEGETVTTARRGADFIERRDYAGVLSMEDGPHGADPYDVHFPVGGLARS